MVRICHFATFLGFNADKVPDIDLNFSDLNQASALNIQRYYLVLIMFIEQEQLVLLLKKTAFGFVKGYFEDKGIMNKRSCEIERDLAMGCTGVKERLVSILVVLLLYLIIWMYLTLLLSNFQRKIPTSAWRTTHFDYHAIDQDLLKLDILGHSDQHNFRLIQELSGTDVSKVPLDDKDTIVYLLLLKLWELLTSKLCVILVRLVFLSLELHLLLVWYMKLKPTTFCRIN